MVYIIFEYTATHQSSDQRAKTGCASSGFLICQASQTAPFALHRRPAGWWKIRSCIMASKKSKVSLLTAPSFDVKESESEDITPLGSKLWIYYQSTSYFEPSAHVRALHQQPTQHIHLAIKPHVRLMPRT